jgi:hypothetical protein
MRTGFQPRGLDPLDTFPVRKIRVLGRRQIISVQENHILPFRSEVQHQGVFTNYLEFRLKLQIAVHIRSAVHPDPLGPLRKEVIFHGDTSEIVFFILLNPRAKSKRLPIGQPLLNKL